MEWVSAIVGHCRRRRGSIAKKAGGGTSSQARNGVWPACACQEARLNDCTAAAAAARVHWIVVKSAETRATVGATRDKRVGLATESDGRIFDVPLVFLTGVGADSANALTSRCRRESLLPCCWRLKRATRMTRERFPVRGVRMQWCGIPTLEWVNLGPIDHPHRGSRTTTRRGKRIANRLDPRGGSAAPLGASGKFAVTSASA